MTATVRRIAPGSVRPGALRRNIFWMGDVVIVTFPRIASGATTDLLTEQVRSELVGRYPRAFVFDCLGTETYTVDVRASGAKLLQTLARAGAEKGCCVTEKSSIRMIGTAVAFVAGVGVKFVRTLPEALDSLQD
jgi:hypothetical protein